MSYRRVILFLASLFIAYLLWHAVQLDTPNSTGTVWPLIFGLLVILMLPEKRLQGDLFVRLIEALKGRPKI